jgi:hypothetical protein
MQRLDPFVYSSWQQNVDIVFSSHPMAWKSLEAEVVDTSLYPPGTQRFSFQEESIDDMDTAKDLPAQPRDAAPAPLVRQQASQERKCDDSKAEKKTKLGSHSKIQKSLTQVAPKPVTKPDAWNFAWNQLTDGHLYLISRTGIYIFQMNCEKKNYFYSNFKSFKKQHGFTQYSASVYGSYGITWSTRSDNAELDYEMNRKFYKLYLNSLSTEEKKAIPTIPLEEVRETVKQIRSVGKRALTVKRLQRLFDCAEKIHSLPSDAGPSSSPTLER